MKTLILLRHAKSSWDDPGLDDHARPLNRRGEKAAPVMARWLAEAGLLPDTILCSSAKRARQTVERMREAVDALPEPLIRPALYHAEPATMLEEIRTLPDGAATAMLVGHEPGLSALAALIEDGRPEPGCSRAFAHFPTAAAAVFRLPEGRWSDLAPKSLRFERFTVPRELMSERG